MRAEELIVKFQRTRDVKFPQRGTPGSAGIDFFVPNEYLVTEVEPHRDLLMGTGIVAEVPEGHALLFMNKSGVALKQKLIVGACLVDSDYRGEIHFHMFNLSDSVRYVSPGQKLCQAVLIPHVRADLVEVDRITVNTKRGAGGFGSTGG